MILSSSSSFFLFLFLFFIFMNLIIYLLEHFIIGQDNKKSFSKIPHCMPITKCMCYLCKRPLANQVVVLIDLDIKCKVCYNLWDIVYFDLLKPHNIFPKKTPYVEYLEIITIIKL